MSEYSFRLDLPAPWSSLPGGGLFLLALTAAVALVTVASYRRHVAVSRRRLALLIGLRVLALVLALVTAARPSVGVRENPAVPSVLLIGFDGSGSMATTDELGGRSRADAVKAALDAAKPTLDELRDKRQVEVVTYRFGGADFAEPTGRSDPALPPDLPQSDYAAYLRRTFDRWQAEPYLRGHLVIGDGADNGTAKPEAEAAKWRQRGGALHTFSVGSPNTSSTLKDVALTGLTPLGGSVEGSVAAKTEFTMRLVIQAPGFVGRTVNPRVTFDTNDGRGAQLQSTTPAVLAREADNVATLKLTAPDKPGLLKLRVEVPVSETPGDVVPENNVIETYLNVTKDGLRVLLVDRASIEQAQIRRALSSDPRMSVFRAFRQSEAPPDAQLLDDFDFERHAYDVIVIGNVSARQLTTIRPDLPEQLKRQVTEKGMGLLFTGGHASFKGDAAYPDATGLVGSEALAEILPVELGAPGFVPDAQLAGDARFQHTPSFTHRDHYLNRVAESVPASQQLWEKLGAFPLQLNALGRPKPTAAVYAYGVPKGTPPAALGPAAEGRLAPVLVGHQIGAGNRGRVLAFAGQDSYFWQALGQPNAPDGINAHARFWRQMVRWCAHQEDDDAQVFARAELSRLPVGAKQVIRVGIRQPGGGPALEPQFPTLKILAPGEDPATAPNRTALPDENGAFRVEFEPTKPGEYTVAVSATGKDAKGTKLAGDATTKFAAFAVPSQETLLKAARPEVLARIAGAGGGQARRLDELGEFLRQLAAQPFEVAKPKPKFYPDWRRDRSPYFLPAWLVLVALVLGLEWGLRRAWGLV